MDIGFGKGSGPNQHTRPVATTFGLSPRPPSRSPHTQPFSASAPLRSPRGPGALERVQSPPLAFEHVGRAVKPSYQASPRVLRPASFSIPMHNQPNSPGAYGNFLAHQDQSLVSPYLGSYASGRNLSTDHDGVQVLKRSRSPPVPPGSEVLPEDAHFGPNGPRRPALFSNPLHNQSNSPVAYANFLAHQDQSSVSPYLGSYASGRKFSTDHDDVQVLKRNSSPPPLASESKLLLEDSHFAPNGPRRGPGAQERRLSPPLAFESTSPAVTPVYQKYPGVHRPARSPPMMATRSNFVSATDSQIHQKFSTPAVNPVSGVVATKPTSPPALKRTRSPSLLPSDQLFPEKSYSTQDGIAEREMQAKAKRLARFKVELSENVQHSPDFTDQKVSATRSEQSIGNQPPELPRDFTNAHVLSDYDGSESSNIITGLCPDMCPESERAERERKGDLDLHERVDGDRNQTSKFLAVKKYTRTAEREASLIRPMPVLRKTIDYLLNLLDLPYDDRFLGTYNFLWDRMRAIRMDLRMQHIFNQGAIVMLEQMIRLHIIVMHELCEHTKGEGFSEGFDAHLNIEQMNKTSVELFQIYDDHRKKGINVPTEREFRGYYALLKLDKHPGYRVEAAELSLDLAKMTPEIRQTPEVLFARDVARSCRTSNFIAFFRLVRRASYLQACLMHAHFAKLRTQALASLHSGLQLNQGIPVAHVAMWLGMEEEDIESLLLYHGFSIKIFEEPYMMKEGPFCNRDKDYPTKCSALVQLKKSRRIIEDVSPLTPAEVVSIPSVISESIINTSNEEMADCEAFSSSTHDPQQQPIVILPTVSKQIEDDHPATGASISPQAFLLSPYSPKPQHAKVGIVWKPNFDDLSRKTLERNDVHIHMEEMPIQILSETTLQERSSDGIYDYAVEKSASSSVLINSWEDAGPSDTHEENKISQVLPHDHVKETAEAKLKLILRLWKRCCTKRREFREQMQVAANAALDSLSLGPPIRQKNDQPSNSGELDIDHVIGERYKKHVESWSRLNVSDVIAGILSRRNPEAKCLCWKLIVCSQMNNLEGVKLGQRSQVARLHAAWLLSKLMPSSKSENDNDLILSSPGLSMWRKWVPGPFGAYLTCCLSMVKDAEFDNLGETVSGASAVLFLVSENIQWKHQRFQLQNLLMSIPLGSCLPLLILSCSYKEETPESLSIMVNELGLHDIDKSRISSFQVVPLIVNHGMEEPDGFFSDEQLREGLKWLASESPRQPVLHNVKTRELVLSRLNCSLEVLERKNDYEVGPNDCISAFNEALDRSLGNIAATAKANPAGWPCPEIALLEESSDEHRVVKWDLPTIGWNFLEKIEPLICALRDSKLPTFTDDISWLGRGSYTGEEIKKQKLELENCLVRYLTEASKMMRFADAMKEASIMLQQGASLELHNSCYYIVPRWTMIFRRIFHWRLANLSTGVFSKAYILECHIAPISGDIDMLALEGSSSSPYYMDHPSLDEVIEVVCSSSLLLGGGQSRPDAFEALSGSALHGQVHEATDHDGDLAITTEVAGNSGDIDMLALEGSSSSPYYMDHPSLDEVIEVVCSSSLLLGGDQSRPEAFEPLSGSALHGQVHEATNHDGDLAITTDVAGNSGTEIVVAGVTTKEMDNLNNLLGQCNMMQNRLGEKLSIYF